MTYHLFHFAEQVIIITRSGLGSIGCSGVLTNVTTMILKRVERCTWSIKDGVIHDGTQPGIGFQDGVAGFVEHVLRRV